MRVSPLTAAALAAAALAGCGGEEAAQEAAATAEQEAAQAGGDESAAPEGAIDVALDEWTVKPAEASAKAGKVVFNARNVGQAPHELEVIETDVPAGEFPVEGARAKVEGEEIGEVEGIAGGQAKVLEVDLKPGHYQLICNLPGHYEPGMYADFEVE